MGVMKVKLQPRVLRWARERAGLSVGALAEKLKIKPERVREWEQTGELRFTQAEKLAKTSYTPFGYLYLETPPEEKLPIPDFRTVGGRDILQPSPELLDVLSDALRRQDWFREYLIANGEEQLSFVGTVKLEDSTEVTAAKIRAELKLDTELRVRAHLGRGAAGTSQLYRRIRCPCNA